MVKSQTRTALIAIVFIAIISVGVILVLASPLPVVNQQVSTSGILTETDIFFTVGWPNSQVQVEITLTSVSAIWAYDIRDSEGTLLYLDGSISVSTTTMYSPWVDASGRCSVTIACTGFLEGAITVYARGPPFVTP